MRTALLLVLLSAVPAAAHGLTVTATPVGDRLRVVAAYDDDTPADGATATLTSGWTTVGRVTLDANGVGELPLPVGDWLLTVDDGAGHRRTLKGSGGSAVNSRAPTRAPMVFAGLLPMFLWIGWRRFARRRASECATGST